MNSLLKVSVVSLISTVVMSCGVLESVPDAESSTSDGLPVGLPATLLGPSTVAPAVTAGGQLATANTEAGGSGNDGHTGALKATTDLAIESIFQTDRCNTLSRGGFIWFTDEVVLNDWLSPLDPDEASEVRSKIDFSKQGALLLDYGIAGSKGSGATIAGNKLEIDGQDALVKVKQFKAPSGKKTAQVVTHPCALFVMPRTGFSKLVVLSELGDELTYFDNK